MDHEFISADLLMGSTTLVLMGEKCMQDLKESAYDLPREHDSLGAYLIMQETRCI